MTINEMIFETVVLYSFRKSLRQYEDKQVSLEDAVSAFNAVHKALQASVGDQVTADNDPVTDLFEKGIYTELERKHGGFKALVEIADHCQPVRDFLDRAEREFSGPHGLLNAIKNPKRAQLVAMLSEARA